MYVFVKGKLEKLQKPTWTTDKSGHNRQSIQFEDLNRFWEPFSPLMPWRIYAKGMVANFV